MKTIEFLPDRLNAETVVFRGFTTPELGYAALIGAVSGLILSLIMMLVTGIGWPIIPTCTLITPLIFIFIGGRFLVRFKRNKPNFTSTSGFKNTEPYWYREQSSGPS
ncbi:TIGR03750 family conjugal transfer protein [Salmonella sp. WGH-01]|nr:TIGR03750 family conjugal transfer protein [Salmonella sp. WGH-01]